MTHPMTDTSKEAIDALVQYLREATNTKGRIRGGAGGQTIECTMRSTFHEVSLWALDETIDALTTLQARVDELEGSLRDIGKCTAEHGGAARALKVIRAALSTDTKGE